MRFLPAAALVLSAFFGAACPLCAEDPKDALAPPLREYDKNDDGKLTGDELTLARQAHRRGGRPADLDLSLKRYRNRWMERNASKFDIDGESGLSRRERKEADRVWRQTTVLFEEARIALIKKYDRDDDGELNGREYEASRREGEDDCKEIEDKVMADYCAAREQKEKEAKVTAEAENRAETPSAGAAAPALAVPSSGKDQKPPIAAPVTPPQTKE